MTSLNLSEPGTSNVRNEGVRNSVFHTLLYSIFQKPRDPDAGGIVIALSSPNPGEGVTYITRALLHELERCEFTSVAGINMSFLRKLHEPTVEAIRQSLSSYVPGPEASTSELAHQHGSLAFQERRGPWEGRWQYRRDCIELLRSEFDYTIIDCPSLKESGDLLSVAPFVDGVILVIEANETRREEPRRAEQSITSAGGNLLGYILNKRTYAVPQFLNRML